ncbi:MAG TPA: replication initiator [Acidimicrobiales bacterium]
MNPRMLSPELVREAALVAGVCARPVVSKVTDTHTGETRVIPIACGSTRESRCPPCADRARRLRMQQCREGWHLDTEPERPEPASPTAPEDSRDEPDADEKRRVRSTRRRQDVPDLPRVPMDDRTVGRVFEAPDGKTYRPSMFLTLTLPSYGRVTAEGVPVDPDRYDYRRAALDAIHFARLVDRFWQNLRRCAGYRVQYFAAVEAQRRLAPHLHAAIRGTIPRRVVRQVKEATYHQVWWPPHDEPVYVDRLPIWTEGGYVDPDTGELLPTWDEALDQLDADPDAEPAHVVRFGEQDDIAGVIAGTPNADRTIGYLCKYLTKSIAGTYDEDGDVSAARAAHIDRQAEEVRWLPCSPGCANWLRYGIQPKGAEPGMTPGHCKGRAHDRENLGLSGRRVLVSRQWSGKTLAGHKADRAEVVRAALEEAGVDPDDHDELSVSGTDGRFSWELLGRNRIDERTYAAAIAEAIQTRQRWRREYEAAKELAAARAGPAPPRPPGEAAA